MNQDKLIEIQNRYVRREVKETGSSMVQAPTLNQIKRIIEIAHELANEELEGK